MHTSSPADQNNSATVRQRAHAGFRPEPLGCERAAGLFGPVDKPYNFRMAHRKPKPRSYRFEIRLRGEMHARLQAAVTATGLRPAAIAQSALDEWLARREQPPLPFVNQRPLAAQTEGAARPLPVPSEVA